MHPERRAVATYIQTFVLIGVAIGGSFAVYNALGAYVSQPPSGVVVLKGAIRQGVSASTESLTLANVGTTQIQSFTILNSGLAPSVAYCYTEWSPVTNTLLSGTCPTYSTNPTSIQLSVPLAPSASVVVLVTLIGASVFVQGSVFPVVVQASNGALASVNLVVGAA